MSGVVTLERAGKIITAGPAELITGDREVAWAQGLIRHNPLYAWVLGRYVSAGEANANGHIFDAGELRTHKDNLVHAPLNMLHRPKQVLGTYVGAELVYPAAAAATGDAPPFLESLAAFWRYYFQEEYAIVKMAHEVGQLAQSMECIPKTVTCATPGGCGATFAYAGRASETYCDDINTPGPRRLNQPHFSAGAIVIPPAVPAWRGAKVTQLSAQLRTAEVEGLAATLYDQVKAAMPNLDESGREQFMASVMALSGPPAAPGPKRSKPGAKDPHSYAEPPGAPEGDGPCTICGMDPDSPIHKGMGDPSSDSHNSDVEDTSVMVALYPPGDSAASIALGGDFSDALSPGDLHVTLAYLGAKATEELDRAAVESVLAPLAARSAPMNGWVSGLGRFWAGYPAGQDTWPLYASIDLPPLPEFRQDLVEALDAAGLPVSRKHGFTPHMTLAYVGPGDEAAAGELLSAGVKPKSLAFSTVVLAWGNERTVFELAGSDDDAAAPLASVEDIIERGRREAASIPVWDPIIGRSFSADKREQLAKKGHAMGDQSLPIENKDDLRHAIKMINRAKDPAAAKRHIIKRAKALGSALLLPEGWT